MQVFFYVYSKIKSVHKVFTFLNNHQTVHSEIKKTTKATLDC